MGTILSEIASQLENVVNRHGFDRSQKTHPGNERVANCVQLIGAQLPKLLRTDSSRIFIGRVARPYESYLPGGDADLAVVIENGKSLAKLGAPFMYQSAGLCELMAVVVFLNRSSEGLNGLGFIVPLRQPPESGRGYALIRLNRQGQVTVWRCCSNLASANLLEMIVSLRDPFRSAGLPAEDITATAVDELPEGMFDNLERWLPCLIEHLDFLTADLLRERRLAG